MTADTTEQILIAVEPLTKRGLGQLQANGFYRNRFPCPKHGGKKPNATLNEHGFIVCHSRCGKIPIPEVMALFGIESARMTAAQRQTYLETRQEQQRTIETAKRERMATNQIATIVRETYAHLPIETYEMMFDSEVSRLMQQWRDGGLQLDLVGSQSALLADWKRDLDRREMITRPRFVSMVRALSASVLHVSSHAPSFDGVFSPGDMHKRLEAQGYKCSLRQVKSALRMSPIVDHVGHGQYEVTDTDSFDMRLRQRLQGAIAKTHYGRKLPLWVYGDSDGVSDKLYSEIERRELHLTKEDGRLVIDRIEAEIDMLIESADAPFAIPDDAGDLRAWWWLQNISEWDKATRGDIYERTGFAPRQQPAIRKLTGCIARARWRYVEAESPQAARALSNEPCFAMPAKYRGQYKLQLASQYGYAGGEVEIMKALDDERKVQYPSTIKDKAIHDENCTLPAPELPTVADDDTIDSVPFITRALWYTMLDSETTTIDEWRGKVVTLAAIEAYLVSLPAPGNLSKSDGLPPPADMLRLDDGTEIPF